MKLVKWNPMLTMSPFERFVEDVLGSFESGRRMQNDQWIPRADITEDAGQYYVHIELPGVSKDDVNITIADHVLSITGEKKITGKDGVNVVFNERVYGTFERKFTLSDDIDHAHIDASFKDGVLTITMPKTERAKRREIKVKGK